VQHVVTSCFFYGEELLAPCSAPELEDHPLSVTAYSIYLQLPSPSHKQRLNNWTGIGPENKENVPASLNPRLAVCFAHHNGMECCIVLEENYVTIQQFWLFLMQGRLHIIM
jgi:hypothetical protein